ncbi:hypothetical protein BFR45_00110 [Brochothrix thermosphacta]|uniref:DUF2179 domain-containing protein n=3 Tax=Brochothrix thermosphacta TaxID=2756 RepID=A0A2X0QMN4_BROTH|nr:MULTISPECIES: YitT family protein [Brochothrix]ANZ95170.1 hypothetical protein BFC19_07170 [Brochothrix thermosphacta]ANZ96526.1 hypothetical protein BFC20_01600 [Brochothrix thermosphacta]ODJ49087.1 hypothetical protein BFR34_07295 [Brochothrix thermosphacta DSM 20171 = FSL F6-1036]ODJ56224.1 hypothetical protein BFR41_04965 [Brochothrix thermosphacta]ODJ56431.1 hypothetical protein BFR38_00480 [Brochothrix thermosphacta]
MSKVKDAAYYEHLKKMLIAILSAFLCAISMKLFLIPAKVYASGLNGAAQLIVDIFHDFLSIDLPMGLLIIALNLPVFWIGWTRVGKSLTFYSFVVIGITAFFLSVIPTHQISDDIILNSIFGGVISAAGVGLALKHGISTGGLDIIALYLSRKNDTPTGRYFMILNGIIIVVAGAVYNWQNALYTLVSRYVNSYVIDLIHTNYQKLTVFIITPHADAVVSAIQENFDRGATIIPAYGGYSKKPIYSVMMVVSNYEIYEIERTIKSVDPKAFIDIVETRRLNGYYHSEKEQNSFLKKRQKLKKDNHKHPNGENIIDCQKRYRRRYQRNGGKQSTITHNEHFQANHKHNKQ